MADCKPVPTPLEQSKKYEKQPHGSDASKAKENQCIIGCSIYAAIETRNDLPVAVEVLNQFMSNPGPENWTGVKGIFFDMLKELRILECKWLVSPRSLIC